MRFNAQENGGTEHPTTGGLQPHGQFRPGAAYTVQDVVKVPRGCSSPGGHFRDGLPRGKKEVLQVHVPKCNSIMLSSQGGRSTCPTLLVAHHSGMAWVQLETFKKRLKEYQKATGKRQAQVAEDLGTTYGTLRFWLAGVRPPGFPNLQRAAILFGCSVTEFIDDPGREIAGQDVSYLSDQARFFAGLFAKDVAMEDLNDEDREQIYRAATKERDWILARKARRDSKGS